MLRFKMALALAALLAMWVGGARAQEPAPAGPTSAPHEVQVTAKKYEFNPNAITVKKGERVRLIIHALDRDHGFKLEAFGIDQVLKKGSLATIDFMADKTGTFEFKCSTFCGFGHRKMKGRVVVEEAAAAP